MPYGGLMRNKYVWIMTIILALTCFSTVIKAEDFDGGFENDTSWSGGTLDSTVFHSGKSSLKITSGQRGEGFIELLPGRYYLTCFVKASELKGSVFIEVLGNDRIGVTLPLTKNSDWKKIWGEIEIREFSRYKIACILIGEGSVWFDDMVFEKDELRNPLKDESGPFYHHIVLAQSKNTYKWELDTVPLVIHGSVPHGILYKDEVFCYYVNGVKHGLFVAHGKTPTNLKIEEVKVDGKLAKNMVDPDVIEIDGKIRLYFLDNFGQVKEHAIRSAVTSDGVNFTKEPGDRMVGEQFTDPDVVKIGNHWFMYLSRGQSNIGFVSKDGLIFDEELVFSEQGSVSDTVKVAGGWRQYYCGGANGGISSRFTTDGIFFRDEGSRILGTDGYMVGDPNMFRIGKDCFMYVKIISKLRQLRPIQPPGKVNPQPPEGKPNPPDESQVIPGTVAPDEFYCKVNKDSDYIPKRGRIGEKLGGPSPVRLMIATSKDGLNFTRSHKIVSDRAAVPDIIIDKNGWIYLYYCGTPVKVGMKQTNVAISKDNGTCWTFKQLKLTNFEDRSDPVDPEIQLQDDGIFRLFVTMEKKGDKYPHTYLAESTDGINFEWKGEAFNPGSMALDPSILKIGDLWHLFCGGPNQQNWHATSSDGKFFNHDKLMRFEKDGLPNMMANGIAVSDGYRFYTFPNPSPGKKPVINSFFTKDGQTWTADAGTRLKDDISKGLEGNYVQDPAIVRLEDGSYLMVYTTEIPIKR